MKEVKIIKIEDYKENVRGIFSDLCFTVKEGERILLKPNLVAPRSADSGVTTNLDLLSALIEVVQEKGAIPILGEGAGYEFDSRTFSILGIDKLAEKYNIQFIDFRDCQTFFKKTRTGEIELPEILNEIDKIINLPKLKTHMLTRLSGGMKNLMGILPLFERRKMHLKGLNKELIELNLIIPTDLTIIDASIIMHNKGPAFGDKLAVGYLLADTNVFAADFVAAKFLNVDPLTVGYLKAADRQGLIPDYAKSQVIIKNYPIIVPKNRAYIFLYWLIYLFDYLQEKLTKKTIIGKLHYYFGARLVLDTAKCRLFPDCRQCLIVCPVKAISKEQGIDFKECAKVRCLKCLEICPHQAIKMKGISKPITKKSNGKIYSL